MVKHVIAELVVGKWIQGAGVAVDGPVACELLWAEHQNALIAQLEVLDDGEGGVGFSQPNAVGQDAAVVVEDLVDGGLGAVFLKRKERPPDARVGQGDAPEIVVKIARAIEIVAKEVKEREVVDELRRLVRVELPEVEQDVLFDVLDQFSSFQTSVNHCFSSWRSRLLSTMRFSSMLLPPLPRPRPRTVKLELPRIASSTPPLAT